MVGLSLGEQNFIKGELLKILLMASGSARVKLGLTDVIASVKAELGKPNPSHPDKGKGQRGRRIILRALHQRFNDVCWVELELIFSSLSIVKGKVCCDLYIDGLVVSSDGNLLDALGAAIKAALSNTAIPKVQVAATPLLMSSQRLMSVTRNFYNSTPQESLLGGIICRCNNRRGVPKSSAISSISINRQGRICGLTKEGAQALIQALYSNMISVAKHVSEQLINKLDSEIAVAEAVMRKMRWILVLLLTCLNY
ncbi:hypothetical protein DH2020_007655 [Rehmannia glutinosa]|uniref:Ribosomal RNA-processing protein 42 n=1 Tax=Rehmannia glutinosa TaxID=99300 RepID=A0ABR0TYU1_REHGL